MKRCKNITCWTDYPFELLNDKPGEKAPIRRVVVLNFDHNKYALVQCLETGATQDLKYGYLYRQKGRCGTVKTITFRKLDRMLTAKEPS